MCLKNEDYAAAEGCFERSLEIKRLWPEKDIPFEFAETLKNMSLVRLLQKRSKDALELARHAVKLMEEDQESGIVTMQKFRLYMAEILANSGQIQGPLSSPAGSPQAGRISTVPITHPIWTCTTSKVYYSTTTAVSSTLRRCSISRSTTMIATPILANARPGVSMPCQKC
ncbi:hypothetical protein BDZ45DRAFT_682260 [Acephala macrosclerotiorum]|nr:hypothetical protein BDZ45DRAFT_682260 [Acephala macrosclerotiorum]